MRRKLVSLVFPSLVVLSMWLATFAAETPPRPVRPATIAEADWQYLYHVKRVVGNHDGDTCELEIDCGLEITRIERVRLYGIDTPERKNETLEAGNASRDHLAKLLAPSQGPFVLKTIKDRREKYGRRLGILYDGAGRDLNRQMLKDKKAAVAPWE